ncbi:MAG: ROK family protein [Synergistales bacterium]|nr:ROK family protein [Synergistales bacterium]
MRIGIDLGGHTITMASLDNDLEICEILDLDTPPSRKLEDVAGVLENNMLYLLHGKDCEGIGIGIPGMMDRKRETVYKLPNFPGWEGIEVPRVLGEIMDLPVYMENDANCYALGEMYKGLGRGVGDFIVFTLGSGIGGGIISEGRLLIGSHGMAGELGHIATGGGSLCGCGATGHLETESGADGLERKAREKGFQPFVPSLWEDRKVADMGDLWDNAFDTLARAICSCIHILDPELIILGGGMSQAKGLLEDISPFIERYLVPSFLGKVGIRVSKLGNRAAVIGAASIVPGAH